MKSHSDPLDELLRLCSQEPVPEIPLTFDAGVWRKIRLRQAEKPTWQGFGQWLSNIWTQPQLGWSAVTASLMVGLLAGWLHTGQSTSLPDANQAFGLNVFSVSAPSLPSTLIVPSEG